VRDCWRLHIEDDISHEGSHKAQASMIRQYVIWRNNHAAVPRPCTVVCRQANVA
jgi:hypothetical protein